MLILVKPSAANRMVTAISYEVFVMAGPDRVKQEMQILNCLFSLCPRVKQEMQILNFLFSSCLRAKQEMQILNFLFSLRLRECLIILTFCLQSFSRNPHNWNCRTSTQYNRQSKFRESERK